MLLITAPQTLDPGLKLEEGTLVIISTSNRVTQEQSLNVQKSQNTLTLYFLIDVTEGVHYKGNLLQEEKHISEWDN